MMKQLNALVLTYNEEDNIADCLDSIRWVERIVVVDSFSDDQTKEICQQYKNVDFYENEFIDFASQRNFGLNKIETEWVFVIDADERVNDNLKREIMNILNKPEAEGYEIARKNFFLGKWIKYCGWYPDYTLRLFKSKYRYRGLVHESPQIQGKVEKLDNELIHYTYKDLESYLDKMKHYAVLGAEKDFNNNKSTNILYVLIRPIFEFLYMYIFRRGFLLGSQGIIISFVFSYYKFIKYALLWEMIDDNE